MCDCRCLVLDIGGLSWNLAVVVHLIHLLLRSLFLLVLVSLLLPSFLSHSLRHSESFVSVFLLSFMSSVDNCFVVSSVWPMLQCCAL